MQHIDNAAQSDGVDGPERVAVETRYDFENAGPLESFQVNAIGYPPERSIYNRYTIIEPMSLVCLRLIPNQVVMQTANQRAPDQR